ncbi:hypothetical protein L1049_018445 [Liquidambar formosana]|uniref:Uncharacterized protein n=1 Tax=Liquidambar formosana TaxID=63359 RepID=A0AAP0RAJ0_LIQFO
MTSSMVIMCTKKEFNRGAWIAEEDQKLAQAIEIHGAKRWKSIAANAGLNRCEKSCRLRWKNYLRPNIKRGNISDQEVDLILRLHKLLGNRWSLIAGRLPGRTGNEIKNYWNSHLCKKVRRKETETRVIPTLGPSKTQNNEVQEPNNVGKVSGEGTSKGQENSKISFGGDEFFDCSTKGPLSLEWMTRFLEEEGDSGFEFL